MKILGLYNNELALELFDRLSSLGHEVVLKKERLDPEWCEAEGFELAVSYTYRYILSQELIDSLGGNVVNLHNSYLPWNRGADPNLWSILEKTPRGVTLHYVDAGLDKGQIIAQSFVTDGEDETLESSYLNLDRAAKKLFQEAFAYVEQWPSLKKLAIGKGSYHSVKDGERMKSVIDSYQMRVSDFCQKMQELERADQEKELGE